MQLSACLQLLRVLGFVVRDVEQTAAILSACSRLGPCPRDYANLGASDDFVEHGL